MIRKEEGKSTDPVRIEMTLSYIYTSMHILLRPHSVKEPGRQAARNNILTLLMRQIPPP